MHTIAIELGMTVDRLSEELTYKGYLDFLQYYQQMAEEPEPEPATPEDFAKAFNIS